MMDPEASVSALVFIHPDCTLFFRLGPSRTSPQLVHFRRNELIYRNCACVCRRKRDKVLPLGGNLTGIRLQ